MCLQGNTTGFYFIWPSLACYCCTVIEIVLTIGQLQGSNHKNVAVLSSFSGVVLEKGLAEAIVFLLYGEDNAQPCLYFFTVFFCGNSVLEE